MLERSMQVAVAEAVSIGLVNEAKGGKYQIYSSIPQAAAE